MRTVTIQLEDEKFEALQAIAKENGLVAADRLVSQEVERLIASYSGSGVSAALRRHLQASIEENRHLLERLAQ